MKKLTLIILLFCCNSLFAAENPPFTGVINSDSINLRIDSTVSSQSICTLKKGERVEVISESYEWYKVRLPKEAYVYVNKNLFGCIKYRNTDFSGKPAVASLQNECVSANATKTNINVRLAPNESSAIVGRVDKGQIINVFSEKNNWYKIEPPNNSYGWISKKFVDKTSIKPDIALQENAMLEGVVHPYGRILWRKGTHKLITDKNEILILKGNKKSLDALNYHKVRVSGKTSGKSQEGYPILVISTIEALN